jgi:DNA-binding transcriptional LysR family regulator
MTTASLRTRPFGKDYVSCLSIAGRHTLMGAVELRHLRYFVAVAEMENVSRAAMQRLHVSQPSLSRQIRDLEDEIGVQLLERTAKSVKLTEAGRAFLNEARAILKHADAAVGNARAIAGKRETELHIGDWPLASGRIMPTLLRAYQKAMPNVKVKVHDWPVEKNIAGVRDGRLQLAIILPPLKANALDELRFEPLFTGRVCLAVSCDHPFALRRSVSLADAAREPFIGLTREEYPRYLEYLSAIFARVNDKPCLVEEQDGWSGVFSSVSAGVGVALTSDAFNYAFDDRIKLVRLTPEPKRVAVGIITRKGKLSPAAEKFCQCSKDAFAAIR